MNLDKELKEYGRLSSITPQEEKISETIHKSLDAFYMQEENEVLSYKEFFWIQLKMIRKRWWGLQALLLLAMWDLLYLSDASWDAQRGISIIAALFVVLIIPELWKNIESDSMEIEEAAFYSLKTIYAVRLVAFGVVDVFMITTFCMVATGTQVITLMELLKQLLFPMVVVAAICFAILGSKHYFHKIVAIVGCLFASGLWTVIVMNEKIYTTITPTVWGISFSLAVLVLGTSVYRVLNNCNRYWEVKKDGIEIG